MLPGRRPDGEAYLARPRANTVGRDHDLMYREFVLAAYGQLAHVQGLAPEWVSINVQPRPDLLKPVTAQLRHVPGRPRLHRPEYFERYL